MLHPVWYLQGHQATVDTLRNPALVFSHQPYPPLVGGSVALTWLVSGVHTDRVGVVLVALLNAFAILGAATVVFETARAIATVRSGSRRTIVMGFGSAIAVALVFVAFAVGKAEVIDGYADILWSFAAVAAVGYGLVLPCESRNAKVAFLFLLVAGTTKLEGGVVSLLIALLIAARLLVHDRRSQRYPALRAGVFLAGTWMVILAWPIATNAVGALPDVAIGGARTGNDFTRLHATVDAAAPNLHVVGIAALVAIVGALCLRRPRQEARLGNDMWSWFALLAGLLVVFYAYTVGPGDIANWLTSSVYRTTLFAQFEGWWILATWGLIAAAEFRWPDREATDSAASEEDAEIGTDPAVLDTSSRGGQGWLTRSPSF